MKRLITITLFALLSFPNVIAQESAALTAELMRFAGNIHQFNSAFPQEKVYLQFDNTSYYAGEVIWFKAFVVNASTLKRSQSRVLYVDLISPTGVLLNQQKLKIVAGQADGSFALLDGSTEQAREKRGILEYPSGFYEIRAYTSYMLNFSEEAIFSRVFAVYEKPKKNGNYYAEHPTITLRKSETTELRPKTEKLRNINCEFYPEGGHLVMGKPCRVAFKVTDDSGFGVEASGRIDGTQTTISTVHAGMGWFTLTPSGRRNSVTITVDGTSRSFTLPQPEQTGISLQADACGVDSLLLRMDCTPDLAGKKLGMAITCRGEIVDFGTIVAGSDPVETVRSMKGIPEGVCRVYIFGAEGSIYASRSVYHHSTEITAPSIQVYADKDKYEPFDKVALRFNLKDGQGNPFRDRFCLSVRDVRGQGNAFTDDLRTSMLLSSDLKGLIENPSWYFDSDDPQRDRALDLLMLVQGWERYDWMTMTGQKEFRERHRLEQSLTLNGWIKNTSGKAPLEGVEVLAALMPQDKTLSETYTYSTDSSGYFGFDIGTDFYDKAKFTIDARAPRKRLLGPSARIVFDRSIRPAIRAYQPQELVFSGLQSVSRSSGKKTKDIEDDGLPTVINVNTGLLLPEVEIEEERMYVDYFTFTAYDVVKDVEIELDKGDYSTDLYGYLLDKGYDVFVDDSSVLLNGFEPFFYVHDNSKYQNTGVFEAPMSLDSKDIKSILVFDRPMYLMDIYMHCPLYQDYMNKTLENIDFETAYSTRMILVDVQVKEPHELSTREELFNISKRITTVDGYSRTYEFYAPEYPDGPVIGDVDFRRTLYWNPNVITDSIGNAQVEFYNSSITNHFNVSAAGMTSGGTPYLLDADF